MFQYLHPLTARSWLAALLMLLHTTLTNSLSLYESLLGIKGEEIQLIQMWGLKQNISTGNECLDSSAQIVRKAWSEGTVHTYSSQHNEVQYIMPYLSSKHFQNIHIFGTFVL